MKLAFFETAHYCQQLFKKAFPDDQLFFFKKELIASVPQEARDARVISVFLCSPIGPDILKQFPKLKLIAARSTGYDNIDLYATDQRGIVVCNVPYYASETVAEYTFALLLSLSRKLYATPSYQVDQKYSFSHTELQGFDLQGKTIGVVGTGNIGKHVIRIAQCFNMKVIAYDQYKDTAYAKSAKFAYCSFDELLERSDIITFHVPLTSETRHMINKKTIRKLKKGVCILNTARGAIIQTDALIEALSKGIVSMAGLDVLEEEYLTRDPLALLVDNHPQKKELRAILENHYLMNHPRVIVTPHNAFNSREALERLTMKTIENIKAWKAGAPTNVVPYDLNY